MASPRVLNHVTPRQPGRITVLQLSDLHFRGDTAVGENRGPIAGYLKDLLDHIDADLKKPQRAIDVIAVTGDLADYQAGLDECQEALRRAKYFLTDTLYKRFFDTGSPQDRLLVIPGNHDVRKQGLTRQKHARQFFQDAFGDYNTHAFYPNLNLLAACFDSNEGWSHFELATGYVDVKQFAALRAWKGDLRQNWSANLDRAFHLALVHHHPLPVPATEALKRAAKLDDGWKAWLASKFIGRNVLGAPEAMLLRNAGVFLRELLRERFRLVLHGHLHAFAYWRALTTTADDESGWLEVLSCGSVTAEESRHAFNLIEITPDGPVQARHCRFTHETQEKAWDIPAMAGYDLIRGERYDQRPAKQPVRCDLYAKLWEVVLPEGDLYVTDYLHGVRKDPAVGTQEVKTLQWTAYGDALTEWDFKADTIGGDWHVTDIDSASTGETTEGQPQARYTLTFKQPLEADKPVDVRRQLVTRGFMFGSTEEQDEWVVTPDRRGHERLEIEVEWPCEQLQLTLRFAVPPFPKQLDWYVHDADGHHAPRERQSGHIRLHYWEPGHCQPDAQLRPSVGLAQAEAVLSVYRPQVGYTYGLRWQLPENDPTIANRVRLRAERLLLLQTEKHPDRAQSFLKDVLQRTNQAGSSGSSLDAFLFAYDEKAHQLKCTAATAASYHPLWHAEFRWGRGAVGIAFRRRNPYHFARTEYASKPKTQGSTYAPFPDEVHDAFLVALPLIRRDDWVDNTGKLREGREVSVGVVVLASQQPASKLEQAIAADKEGKWMHGLHAAVCDLAYAWLQESTT